VSTLSLQLVSGLTLDAGKAIHHAPDFATPAALGR
jgi:hypothetical protein